MPYRKVILQPTRAVAGIDTSLVQMRHHLASCRDRPSVYSQQQMVARSGYALQPDIALRHHAQHRCVFRRQPAEYAQVIRGHPPGGESFLETGAHARA